MFLCISVCLAIRRPGVSNFSDNLQMIRRYPPDLRRLGREDVASQCRPSLGSVSEKRRPNSEVARLRGQVWLSHAIFLSELPPEEFAARFFYDRRTRPGLFNKWMRGVVSPSNHSVRRVTGPALAARRTFEHPLFELLKDETLPAARIWRILARLLPESVLATKGSRVRVCELRGLCELSPKPGRRGSRPFRSPIWLPPDSWPLKCQPSLDSFAKLVGLMRAAEALQHEERHCYWAQEVFRLLPAALRAEWLYPFLEPFTDIVDSIRQRVPTSGRCAFYVDRKVLKDQLTQDGFRPLYRDQEAGLDPIRINRHAADLLAPLSRNLSRRLSDLV